MTQIDETAIEEWAHKTFPTSNPRSLIRHLREEIDELGDAELDERHRVRPSSAVTDEIGDLGLMLVHLASMYGTTLADCIEARFRTASTRRYEYRPDLGYAKHVEETDEERERRELEHIERRGERFSQQW